MTESASTVDDSGQGPFDTSFEAIRRRVGDDRADRLGRLIRENVADLIERWLARAKQEFDYGGDHTREELVDDFPDLLEAIGRDLPGWDGQSESDVWSVACEHGSERWKQNFELTDVVRDYQILRAVMTGELSDRLAALGDSPLTKTESSLLHKIVDEAVVASVETYSRWTRRRLQDAKDVLSDKVEERTRQIRSLSQALMEAEVAERERVAQILHENVQQTLFAIRIRCAGSQTIDVAEQKEMLGLLDEVVEITRSLAVDLAPPVLKTNGMIGTLQWIEAKAEEQFGLVTSLEIGADCREIAQELTEAEQSFLFRFVQECLLNAAKHSESTNTAIRLWNCGRSLCLTVQDGGPNGQKLVEAFEHNRLGFGLTGLRRQARLLGGEVKAEVNDQGTAVSVELPVADEGLRRMQSYALKNAT